ncbi:MAG: hypothetical protein F9K47_19570 [Burkholderiales bacterium]|nr:MAG: hypothetical protein F9K47_19570 [Burkholderiales bacterium]
MANRGRDFVATVQGQWREKSHRDLRILAQDEFSRLGLHEALVTGQASTTDAATQRAFFEALHLLAFTTQAAEHALALRAFADSRQVAPTLTVTELRQVYGVLIAARQFAAAQAWQKRMDEAAREFLPIIIDRLGPGASPSVWVVGKTPDTLERQVARELAGAQVIMIAGLGCPFSQAALRGIAADPLLAARLAPLTQWLVLPESRLGFRDLRAWNEAHPTMELMLIHNLEDWALVERPATPQFFFLRDGKVVARIAGWPKEGRSEAMHDALDALEHERTGVTR